MRSKGWLVVLALAGALVSGAALARVHWDFGIYLGPGYWPYAPYYYYPPAPLPPAAPPATVEQSAPPPPENWWHYCPASKAYYPYVRECPGGWQRVSPTPPN